MTELSSTASTTGQSQLCWRWKVGWWEDVCFGLLPALALMPLVCLEFMQLWTRVHMRFFPLLILVVIAFVAWHWQSNRNQSAKRSVAAHGIQIVAALLLVANWSTSSPWLAHFCFILIFVGWALERFGNVPWPRVAAWGVLFATMLRLPANMDARLLSWLEQTSVAIVAAVLDGVSQPYLLQVGTMTVAGKDALHVLVFSIEPTVRSVCSLNALCCLCVLLLVIRKRSLIAGVVMLSTVPLWYIAMVVIQLLTIISAMHFLDMDLSVGRKLVVLSCTSFTTVVCLLWLADRFVAKLLYPVPAFDSQFESEFRVLNAMIVWPQPDPFLEDEFHTPRVNAKPNRPTPRWDRVNVIARRVCMSSLTLALVVSVGISNRAIADARNSRSLPWVTEALLASVASKETLPSNIGELRLINFDRRLQYVEDRRLGELKWRFAWQDQIVDLNVTFPSNSESNPTISFNQLGWRVLAQQEMKFVTNDREGSPPDNSGSAENWIELKLENELGGGALAMISDRVLSQVPSEQELHYQISLLCESGDELSQPQLISLRQSFQLAIAQILSHIDAQIAKVVAGDSK